MQSHGGREPPGQIGGIPHAEDSQHGAVITTLTHLKTKPTTEFQEYNQQIYNGHISSQIDKKSLRCII